MEALRLDPDDAHRLLAAILFSRGDRQRAIAEFENAIRIRQNFWGNYRALGIAHFRAGEYEKAAAALTRVTELQPDLSWGFQTLGAIYHTAGDVKRAAENYERAIALGPSAAAYSNLGTIHYRQGNFDEAVRLYQASLELQPKPINYRNLGDAYQRLGEEAKARDAFGQAKTLAVRRLDVNPKDAATLGALAVYEAKLGEERAAVKHADDAVSLAPTDADVLYRRAVVHALVGEVPDAARNLGEALRRGYSLSEADLDDDLETLRSTDSYKVLLEQYRKKENR